MHLQNWYCLAMDKITNWFKGEGSKDEKAPKLDQNLEAEFATLAELPGPEYINKLRELKKTHPDLAESLKLWKGDKQFKKDIESGLFFLKTEDPDNDSPEWTRTPDYQKTMEPYYYPEKLRGDRRHMRRVYGGIIATLTTLAVGAGISYYEAEKSFQEDEDAEHAWEAQKLPMTLAEIEQQADTIYQGLSRNFYLFEAHRNLTNKVDSQFREQQAALEDTARNNIVNYLDSLQAENPELLKNVVLEYWKKENGMASEYYSLAFYPANIEKPIDDEKDAFKKEQEELKAKKEALLARLEKAYKDADGGKTVSFEEAQREAIQKQDGQQTPEVKQDTLNSEYLQFTKHIDSLMSGPMSELAETLNSPLAKEISELEVKIQAIVNEMNAKKSAEVQKVTDQEAQEIQNVLNADAKERGIQTQNEIEGFSSDVWEYLKDYYLVNEVFRDYDGISDTASENELAVFEKDPEVMAAFKKLNAIKTEAEKRLGSKITDIKARFAAKKQETIWLVESDFNGTLVPLQQELAPKIEVFNLQANAARGKYLQTFKDTWNTELTEQGITSVKPMQ